MRQERNAARVRDRGRDTRRVAVTVSAYTFTVPFGGASPTRVL